MLIVSLLLVGFNTTEEQSVKRAKNVFVASEPVPPFDPATVDPAMFEVQEYIWAYHLVHLPTVANAVLMEGEHSGFIGIPVWRSKKDNQPYNARVLENHLSLAFFYTTNRPWNPYHGNPALRARLEAVLDFWCRSQGKDGLFAEYRPQGWGLPATSFGIKAMGETLRLLDESKRTGGPTIDPAIHQRTIAAARLAIEALLTNPGLIAHGKRFSNQYNGFWGGALAFLSVHPDDSLRRRLTERIREVIPGLSSPAGYHYEEYGCDWGYTLGTHRNNVRHVWNYAQETEVGDWIVAMDRPWVEWLAYNAVREPDGSYFTLNRAIETRTGAGGFATWEFPLAEQIPLSRAFTPTVDEHQAELRARRQHLLKTWPAVGRLTDYAPNVFVHRLDRHPWYPTDAERAAAVAQLPYLARDRFAHQRVDDRPVSLSLDLTVYNRFEHQRADDRHPMSSTFVRRPGYYAAFNAGAKVTAMQRYGLGLLWSPKMGTVIQAQSRNAAPWGTAPAGGKLYEASSFQPTMHVGGQPIAIEPGARDLPGGETHEVVFTYPLAENGLKTLTFANDHIAVKVVHQGLFIEHLPLLLRRGDDLVIEPNSVRLQRGDQMLVIALTPGVQVETAPTTMRHGPFRVVQVTLTAAESLDYRLTFKTVTD